MTLKRAAVGLVAGAFSLLVLSACAGGANDSASVELKIGAASSMTDVMKELATQFQLENPTVRVVTSPASSAVIAAQLEAGAPLDVFISAGADAMQKARDSQLVGQPADFTTNTLEVAVPLANPVRLSTWTDISKKDVETVRCVEAAPCGVATNQLLAKNNISINTVSLDADVRAVLTRVTNNQADAGIVYTTDVRAAGSAVVGLTIPAAANVSTQYQAAVVMRSRQAGAAAEFVAFLSSPAAQATLRNAGFGSS